VSVLVYVPMVGVNDEYVTVVGWKKSSGDLVRRGEVLCVVETTKATVDIEATSPGYLVCLAEVGKSLKVGELLAALTDQPNEDISPLLPAPEPPTGTKERRWTKKAALLARRMGIDLEKLAVQVPGRVISEQDVLTAQKDAHTTEEPKGDLVDEAYADRKAERVLVLGGGGGAVLVIDIMARIPTQRPVGVLDNNPKLHGKAIMGVPVLGPTSRAEEFWEAGFCDGVIITFVRDLKERAEYFVRLSARGVRFTNVVDASADIRSNVSLGSGNLIIGHSYLAPCVRIGDNNFLAVSTCIEHHSLVGSHCAFGPRFTASGRVVIGNRVKFGTGVCVEPFVTIGDDAVITSGAILTGHVGANSVVKAHVKVNA
jgi:sugar O-acyltransferase (sialic acid O-acetyltransferase NeuD family)